MLRGSKFGKRKIKRRKVFWLGFFLLVSVFLRNKNPCARSQTHEETTTRGRGDPRACSPAWAGPAGRSRYATAEEPR